MKMRRVTAEVNVASELIGEIVADTIAQGLLCDKCTALIESRIDAGQAIEQNEICLPCQAVINQFVQAEFERRVREEMNARGIPAEALQIGDKQ